VIDPGEIQALKAESDKVDQCRRLHRPRRDRSHFLSGQAYYVVPDGRGAEKPYALIVRAWRKKGLHEWAVCHCRQAASRSPTCHGKDPRAGRIDYEDEIKKPAEFEADSKNSHFRPRDQI